MPLKSAEVPASGASTNVQNVIALLVFLRQSAIPNLVLCKYCQGYCCVEEPKGPKYDQTLMA